MAANKNSLPPTQESIDAKVLPDIDESSEFGEQLLADPAEPYYGAHQHAAASEVPIADTPDRPLEGSVEDALTDRAVQEAHVPPKQRTTREALIAERASAIGDQVKQDAKSRGYGGDMQGLSITLGNGYRYVVRDTYEQKERRTEKEKTWLPRTTTKVGAFGETTGGGLRSFRRQEKSTRSKKHELFTKGEPHVDRRAFPRLSGIKIRGHGRHEQSGIVLFQRRETGLSRKFQRKPMVLVETYDEDGQLVSVKGERRDSVKGEEGALDKIFKQAGEHGIIKSGPNTPGSIDWEERRGAQGPTQQFDISLPGYASRDRTDAEAKKENKEQYPAVFDVITGNLEHEGVRNWEGLSWQRRSPGSPNNTIRQEIIKDVAVKEVTDEGYEWVRNFVIRTTHRTPAGTHVSEETQNQGKFREYLESGSVDLTFSDMQLTREAPEAAAGYVAPAHQLTAQEGLQLLSYPEMFERVDYDSVADRDAAMQKYIDAISKDQETMLLAAEIPGAIDEVGTARFDQVVIGMSEAFETSAKQLRLEKPWDVSATPVIRELMRVRLAVPNVDVFEDSLEGDRLRASIVDLMIGRQFRQVVVSVGEPQRAPTGEFESKSRKDGTERIEPEVETKRPFHFNDGWFGRHSVVDGPSIKKKKQRDKIFGPINKQAHKVGNLYSEGPIDVLTGQVLDEVPAEEYAKLGRLLRRTVAQ